MPKHPRTIEGRLLYGRALDEAGEPARSVEQLAQAVSEAAEVFGPSSRMVGFFSLPLSEFQLETGQVIEAVESSRTAVDIIAQHTNRESFRYAAAVHQRGIALLAARRVDEALPDLAVAAETLRRTLPARHLVTRQFEADHALALARAGRHREAEELLAALLPQPGGPAEDASETLALYSMGVAKRLVGDPGAALQLQRQALQSTRPDRGAGNPTYAGSDGTGTDAARSPAARAGGRVARGSADSLSTTSDAYRRRTAVTFWTVCLA